MIAVLEVLKTILIVLGCVVGGVIALVLVLLAVLLFVPFRYEVSISHESAEAQFLYGYRVSWLLRAVSLRKKIDDSQTVLKVIGIPIKRMGGSYDDNIKSVEDGETDTDQHDVKTTSDTILSDDEQDRQEQEKQQQKQEKQQKKEEKEAEKEEKKAQKEERQAIREEKKERKKNKHKKPEPKREPTFIEKQIERIKSLINSIKSKIIGIKDKIHFIFQKISSIIEFVSDVATRRTIRKLLREVVNLIKYIGPRKLRGTFRFGTGDPSSTGMLLGGISLLPVVYQKGVLLSPDFEEKVFVGEGDIVGRIRLVYLVRLIIRLVLDKEVRWVYRQYKKMSG